MQGIKHKISSLIIALGLFGLVTIGLGLANTAVVSAIPAQARVVAAGNFEGTCEGSIDKDDCGITAYIVTFTQVLSGVVGIVVTIMIVWGGIKYSMSKDNPQETAAAKNTIRNALIALVFYFFTAAFLNYLIPGGIT